jgi:hypothetical protein
MSIYVKNFGDYAVKSVKSFSGRDGCGFNANLYRGSKKVAALIDSGNGGEVSIEWLVGTTPRTHEDSAGWAAWHKAVKKEEDLLNAHIKTLDKVESEHGGNPLIIDAGWFVTDCVTQWERDRDIRKMQRQCVTKTLFRTSDQKEGEYSILNMAFDTALLFKLYKQYPKGVEIFNEVFDNGGIPSVINI